MVPAEIPQDVFLLLKVGIQGGHITEDENLRQCAESVQVISAIQRNEPQIQRRVLPKPAEIVQQQFLRTAAIRVM